jgi:hypothetical protein
VVSLLACEGSKKNTSSAPAPVNAAAASEDTENPPPTIESGSEPDLAIRVGITETGAGYQGSIVNSSESLLISLDAGPLSGTSLEVEPGTFSIATQVTIVEGAPLATAQNSQTLGNNMTAAGKSVIISSSSFEDPSKPIPMNLALDLPANLLTNDQKVGVIFMSVIYGEQFKVILGIIPSSQVERANGKIKFGAPYFGAYQPVLLPAEIDKEFRLEIDQDIISASGDVVIVDGGDKIPPIPGNSGNLTVMSLDHASATIGFEIGEDNFSEAQNLAYLAYFSQDANLDSIAAVEAAMPIGDYRRKITTIRIDGLGHSQTYHINVIVRDEMNNKAIYNKISVTTITPNFAPQIATITPSESTVSHSYRNILNLAVSATDGNGDSLSYEWLLNANTSSRLVATDNTASFTPSLDYAGLNTIEVLISDGSNTVSQRWQVNVHLFQEGCMNLDPGNICTLAGAVNMGDGAQPLVDMANIRMSPSYVTGDGAGNLFVSDSELHVIWFYNQSDSPVTRLGSEVPAHTLAILAGSGALGIGTDNDPKNQFALGRPKGIAYDSDLDLLYVALYESHAVVRIGSNGLVHRIFGTGSFTNLTATNTDGNAGTSHVCVSPIGVSLDQANDALYVACNGTHTIKKVTSASHAILANITASIVVGKKNGGGTTTSGALDGALGGAGAAFTFYPVAVRFGPDGNLYFIEHGSGNQCRIRVANLHLTNAKGFFNNAISAAANSVTTIMGGAACTNIPSSGVYSSLRFLSPNDLDILESNTGDVKAFLISNSGANRVTLVNNSASPITLGNRTITAYNGDSILGNGSGGFNGDTLPGASTRIYFPLGISIDATRLYIVDSNNKRLRSLDLTADNGEVTTVLGSGKGIRGFSGDLPQAADSAYINFPVGLAIVEQELFFSDMSNFRIRSLNLRTGLIKTAIGAGLGDGSDGPALTTLLRNAGAMVADQNTLYFVDEVPTSFASDRTCKIRAYNLSLNAQTVFDNLIYPANVGDIAGNFTAGCQSWLGGTYEGLAAVEAPLPTILKGLARTNNYLYLSTLTNNCILRLSESGTIERAIGQCGAPGDFDGPISNAATRLHSVTSMTADPANPDNLFLADGYYLGTGKLKYANFGATAVTINGTEVAAGHIKTIRSFPTSRLGAVAAYAQQVCVGAGEYFVSPGNYHGVLCFDRSTANSSSLYVNSQFTGVAKAGRPVNNGQENIPASSASLYAPVNMVFDVDGNLYIVESQSQLIRKVAKWW